MYRVHYKIWKFIDGKVPMKNNHKNQRKSDLICLVVLAMIVGVLLVYSLTYSVH